MFESIKYNWLVTGGGGFIGANLAEALLRNGQNVTVLDNLATGSQRNLDYLKELAEKINLSRDPNARNKLRIIYGDIRDFDMCLEACKGVDYVLHQAALGSVPRSVSDPLASHANNVDGFINILQSCVQQKVRRLVYASSSSVYGDSAELPKVETRTGRVLSPYAATKAINEIYADVFFRTYGLESIGLRYFNVFGKFQSPNGAYAAVIPRWISSIIKGETLTINGDGSNSRDFCFVENVVQANFLAAIAIRSDSMPSVFNIACGERTTLNDLAQILHRELRDIESSLPDLTIQHGVPRAGDIPHSHANIDTAINHLGYRDTQKLEDGLKIALPWYLREFNETRLAP